MKNIRHILSLLKYFVYLAKMKIFHFLDHKQYSPKVLVVMNAGIGNAIEVTPLISAMHSFWPKATISVYVPAKNLFDNWKIVNQVILEPEELNGLIFDHTFMCCGGISSKANPKSLGKIHRVSPLVGVWYRKPEREYHLDILRRFGYKDSTPPAYASSTKPAIALPESFFRLCIAPGGNQLKHWKYKKWPYYNHLIVKLLSDNPEIQICIIGTDQDDIPGELPEDSRLIDLRGRLSLSETAWIFKHSDFVVGNDCGPLHIADAVQTPSVVIYGPTCELKNGLIYGTPIHTNIGCRPCQYNEQLEKCESPLCMKDLTVDQVLDKIKQRVKS